MRAADGAAAASHVTQLGRGEYFGEMSVFRAAPRARRRRERSRPARSSRSAARRSAGCWRRVPEFRAEMEARIAQYDFTRIVAQVPADVDEELLPAGAAAQEQVGAAQVDQHEAGGRRRRKPRPFEAEGRLHQAARPHPPRPVRPADRRDGLRRRVSGDGLPPFRPAGEPRAHPAARATPGSTAPACDRSARPAKSWASRRARSRRRCGNLDRMPLPAIVHWDGDHWLVVLRRHARRTSASPTRRSGCGACRATSSRRAGSGYAALFDYTPQFETAPTARAEHRLDVAVRPAAPAAALAGARPRRHRQRAADGAAGIHAGRSWIACWSSRTSRCSTCSSSRWA